MTDIRRLSPTAWEWRVGQRGFGIRVFTNTQKILYSSWLETFGAPVFDDGGAQSFQQFLTGEPAPFEVPDDVLKEIRAVFEPPPSTRRGFGRMRKPK